MPKRLGADNGS